MLIFSEYYGDFFSLKINIIKIKKYFFIFNYNYIIIFFTLIIIEYHLFISNF